MKKISSFVCSFLLFATIQVHAVLFESPTIVIIGDSLSDTGNLSRTVGFPTTPPYYQELSAWSKFNNNNQPNVNVRFSDGRVWVEHLESDIGSRWDAEARNLFGLGGLVGLEPIRSSDPTSELGANFAFAGAQTFGTLFGGQSLSEQTTGLANVLRGGIFSPQQIAETLYVVQGGGNDLLSITSPADAPVIIENAANGILSYVEELASVGATQFLVPNLTGYIVADDWVNATPAAARLGAQAFNAILEAGLEELRNTLGIDIYEVDFFSLFDEIAANPLAFGIENVDEPCFDLSATLAFEGLCSDPTKYLMFDALHPTSVAHRLMGERAVAALPPLMPRPNVIPEPNSLVLGLLALSIVGVGRFKLRPQLPIAWLNSGAGRINKDIDALVSGVG